MNILQKAPKFVGKSAVQNSEIYALDIVSINNITNFYSRPRDNDRYSFIEITLDDNYFDSDEGNFLSSGNKVYVINPINKDIISAIIVTSEGINPTESKTTIKSLNSDLLNIDTTWKLILSCGLDYTQIIEECPPITNFRASFITKNSVKLTWTTAFKSEVNYVRIKKTSEIDWLQVYETPGSIGSIVITTLTPDTDYQCQITNRCETNKSNLYSDIITFSTPLV